MAKLMRKRNRAARGKKFRRIKRTAYARKKGVVMLAKSLNEHFPPALRTKLTVNCPLNMANVGGVGTVDGNCRFNIYKGNSIIACGPAAADAGNAPGSYGNNYPAGIDYLLGNVIPGGVIGNAETAPYSRYLVIKSSIIIRITPELGNINQAVRMTLTPFAGDAGAATVIITQSNGNFVEQPYSKHRIVPFNVTSAVPVILKNSMSTKKIYGINKNVTTDDILFTGVYNTSPANPWTWIFGVNNSNNSLTTALSFTGDVRITYDVIFFDRNIFKSQAPT